MCISCDSCEHVYKMWSSINIFYKKKGTNSLEYFCFVAILRISQGVKWQGKTFHHKCIFSSSATPRLFTSGSAKHQATKQTNYVIACDVDVIKTLQASSWRFSRGSIHNFLSFAAFSESKQFYHIFQWLILTWKNLECCGK